MWGAIAGSAVLLGAVVAAFFKIPKRIIGWIMAFGTGTLIGAAAFELLGDAIQDGGLASTAIGFVVGAVVYTIFDLYISNKGGANRKRSYYGRGSNPKDDDVDPAINGISAAASNRAKAASDRITAAVTDSGKGSGTNDSSGSFRQGAASVSRQEDGGSYASNKRKGKPAGNDNANGKDGGGKSQSGLGIFAGTVMDAIPESIMIGASLLTGQGVSWVLVVSIFVSNIPEGLSSTVGMQQSGFSRRKIFWMWIVVLAISSAASMLGYLFLEMLPKEFKAGIGAFAGGGIIAMLCSTMAPEAYEEGGPIVGLIASLGLLAALVLSI
ncbi:ZIP family metal transporter [Paenibacillus sp. WLX1005]|uniref:ZIP family metal transporter n=1 Tax=Paenibacillus sp. WLX1005 TaxID=3243766 RepID=UPI003983E86C